MICTDATTPPSPPCGPSLGYANAWLEAARPLFRECEQQGYSTLQKILLGVCCGLWLPVFGKGTGCQRISQMACSVL